MKRFIPIIIMASLAFTTACEDDSDDKPSSSSNNNNNGNQNTESITGVYSGTEITVYTEKGTSNVLQIDTLDETYEVTGSDGNYKLNYNDAGTTYSLDLTVNGNNFTATGEAGNAWFEGETYSGTFSNLKLTMNYTGEDSDQGVDYTYSANYEGFKPVSTGGGSDFLTIPGESNTGLSGIVDCQTAVMEASFGTADPDFWYAVEIGFDSDIDQLAAGDYILVPPTTFPLASDQCYITISHQDFNSGQVDAKSYASTSTSGTISISIVNGKVQATGNSIDLENDGNSSVKSISVRMDCP